MANKIARLLAVFILPWATIACVQEVPLEVNLKGAVVDVFGNPEVLSDRDGVAICTSLTLQVVDGAGNVQSADGHHECFEFVIEQDGTYSITVLGGVPYENFEIKNVNFYLRRYDADLGYVIVGSGKLEQDSLIIDQDESATRRISATVNFDFVDLF